jgi:hypothetical protein
VDGSSHSLPYVLGMMALSRHLRKLPDYNLSM